MEGKQIAPFKVDIASATASPTVRSAGGSVTIGTGGRDSVNYLVRLRVSTHVTTAMVERLPIPRGDDAPGACREIAAMARLLARSPEPAVMARLQARVAHVYQLSRPEFAHVPETFPLIGREERERAMSPYVATEAHR